MNISEQIISRKPELKYKQVYSYAKIYPDFVKIIKFTSPIIAENFVTSSNGLPGYANEENDREQDYLQKSINRTKTKISDYVLCNNFSHFVTFTLDPKKVNNRYDFTEASSLLKNWLKTEQTNHQRNHNCKFKYLIIPERHKDGAWHFHALFENYRNDISDFYSVQNQYITLSELKTAKRYSNRKFINRYTLGRSEIALIRDKSKMSNYIKKYITKELISESNAKRFWSSRNLRSPEIIENFVTKFTIIPEKFKTITHNYHSIYQIPLDDDYFIFLNSIFNLELSDRRRFLSLQLKKMKRQQATI